MAQTKPRFRYYGNTGLLQTSPRTAFLSSNVDSPETNALAEKWALEKAQDGSVIISGFQSPTERVVLDTLLQNGGKAILLMAARIFPNCPRKYEDAVLGERLLIISTFPDEQVKVTRDSAEKRNQQVIDHCENIVIGCIRKGGMTERLIQSSQKEVTLLDKISRK